LKIILLLLHAPLQVQSFNNFYNLFTPVKELFMNRFLVMSIVFMGIQSQSIPATFGQVSTFAFQNEQTNASTIIDVPFIVTHESINGKKSIRIFDRGAQSVYSILIPNCDDRFDELVSVLFHPSEAHVSIACGSSVTVWSYYDAELIHTFSTANGASVRNLVYSRDGASLALSSSDGSVSVWDTTTGTMTRAFSIASSNNTQQSVIQFSPDGKRLLAGSGSEVKVMDIFSGLTLFELKNHTNDVESISFSNFANEIITKSTDGNTFFWNATTGEALFSVHIQRSEWVY